MQKVLIDSSVWIDFFKNAHGITGPALLNLLDEDRAVLTGIVELEILQGLRPQEAKRIESLFESLTYIESTRNDFIAAGRRLNELRKQGITIPASDCLIAIQCLHRNLLLFTLDKDFDYLPDVKRYRHKEH